MVAEQKVEKSQSWKMFNRISSTYDLLNHTLSFGIDRLWRSFLTKKLSKNTNQRLLDVATGTGDVLLAIANKRPDFFKEMVGLDMAKDMLAIAEKKVKKNNANMVISFVEGDACDLPFEADSFDAQTIAFGIRNVPDVPKALSEFKRVLKTNGKSYILEFSLPENRLMRGLYLIYFRYICPFIGSLVSGDTVAYSYLNQSVEAFPSGEDFMRLMKEAGFKCIEKHPLTMGIATLYIGKA